MFVSNYCIFLEFNEILKNLLDEECELLLNT